MLLWLLQGCPTGLAAYNRDVERRYRTEMRVIDDDQALCAGRDPVAFARAKLDWDQCVLRGYEGQRDVEITANDIIHELLGND